MKFGVGYGVISALLRRAGLRGQGAPPCLSATFEIVEGEKRVDMTHGGAGISAPEAVEFSACDFCYIRIVGNEVGTIFVFDYARFAIEGFSAVQAGFPFFYADFRKMLTKFAVFSGKSPAIEFKTSGYSP